MFRYISIYILAFIFLQLIPQTEGLAQEDTEFSLERYEPITIDLEEEEEEENITEKKKKKRKKKVFYGIKTKRGFIKSGFRNKVTYTQFYYLKEAPEIDPYVREIFWYDKDRRRIRSTPDFDPEKGFILHGPHKKFRGELVLEKGIYYKGTKHGRWTAYNNDTILIKKEKYYRGWPKESRAVYYDKERTKLKEIIPVRYGEVEGDYYMFYKNGQVAVHGKLQEGEKIGKWTEYYDFGRRRKREIVYQPTAFEQKEFQPFINKEWNRRGQLIYERDKFMARMSR